jgi:hypothetical protein
MKAHQCPLRMPKSLRVPLPLSGGELAFQVGQLATVDARLADL